MKKDAKELTRLLELAKGAVTVGGLYRHAKGAEYWVVDIALREATLEPEVIYYAMDNPEIVWTRPLKEFQEKFDLIK